MFNFKAVSAILLLAGLSGCANKSEWQLLKREQAFSDRAQTIGYQQAFVEFFAADGLALQPHPIVVHQQFAQAPRDNNNLIWTPQFAFTSSQGDIGFTSGPWQYRAPDNSVLASGYFCSSWRKSGEQWQVIVDGGGNAPRAWTELRQRAWHSESHHRADALPADANAFANAASAIDAVWQLPGRDLAIGAQRPDDLRSNASLKLLRENIAVQRDAATALYQWQNDHEMSYLHTAWIAQNGQWLLQMACLSKAPARDEANASNTALP